MRYSISKFRDFSRIYLEFFFEFLGTSDFEHIYENTTLIFQIEIYENVTLIFEMKIYRNAPPILK